MMHGTRPAEARPEEGESRIARPHGRGPHGADLDRRVFWAAFAGSAIFMAATLAIALTIIANENDPAFSEDVSNALARLAEEASKPTPKSDALLAEIQVVRREYTRARLLRTDALIRTALAIISIVAVGAVAAFGFARIAGWWATRRWRRLWEGLARVRDGDVGYRFPEERGEYRDLGVRLNELLTAVDEHARVAQELRALRSWGDAASYMAHQIRTPLSSILYSAATVRDALTDAAIESDGLCPAIERIEAETARSLEVVRRLRTLSDFGDLALERVDPQAVIRSAAVAVAQRHSHAPADAVRVCATASVEPPLFDRHYLEQAFVNLFGNSADASRERDIAYTVRCTMDSPGGTYRIAIEDGITDLDPEEVEQIGRRGFTTKPDGSGLGVWLVGRIASLHGGTMKTLLSPGGGLRIEMVFPRRRP